MYKSAQRAAVAWDVGLPIQGGDFHDGPDRCVLRRSLPESRRWVQRQCLERNAKKIEVSRLFRGLILHHLLVALKFS